MVMRTCPKNAGGESGNRALHAFFPPSLSEGLVQNPVRCAKRRFPRFAYRAVGRTDSLRCAKTRGQHKLPAGFVHFIIVPERLRTCLSQRIVTQNADSDGIVPKNVYVSKICRSRNAPLKADECDISFSRICISCTNYALKNLQGRCKCRIIICVVANSILPYRGLCGTIIVEKVY